MLSQVKERTGVAKTVFIHTWESIQFCCYYCLYQDEEGEDFSKQQVKNFNQFVAELNCTLSHDEIMEEGEKLRNVGLDCKKFAVELPFRAKLKMSGLKKFKFPDVVIVNGNDAIEMFMILSLVVLRKHYKFTIDRCKDWFEKVKVFSLNYATGMKDKHVIDYFKMECDLEID